MTDGYQLTLDQTAEGRRSLLVSELASLAGVFETLAARIHAWPAHVDVLGDRELSALFALAEWTGDRYQVQHVIDAEIARREIAGRQ